MNTAFLSQAALASESEGEWSAPALLPRRPMRGYGNVPVVPRKEPSLGGPQRSLWPGKCDGTRFALRAAWSLRRALPGRRRADDGRTWESVPAVPALRDLGHESGGRRARCRGTQTAHGAHCGVGAAWSSDETVPLTVVGGTHSTQQTELARLLDLPEPKPPSAIIGLVAVLNLVGGPGARWLRSSDRVRAHPPGQPGAIAVALVIVTSGFTEGTFLSDRGPRRRPVPPMSWPLGFRHAPPRRHP